LKMVLPCFGKHCNGAHQLPVPMFHEPELYDVSSAYPNDFPAHVTYSFHRGIPIPHDLPVDIAKMIVNEESKAIANRIYGRTPVVV
jgi:hypothetical protein